MVTNHHTHMIGKITYEGTLSVTETDKQVHSTDVSSLSNSLNYNFCPVKDGRFRRGAKGTVFFRIQDPLRETIVVSISKIDRKESQYRSQQEQSLESEMIWVGLL